MRIAIAGTIGARNRQRPPDVDVLFVAVGAVRAADVTEARRQHPDYLERSAREPDGRSDDRRIAAEPSRPESVTQHHHVRAALDFVVEREITTEQRTKPRDGEEPGSGLHAAQLLGLTVIGDLEIVPHVGRQPLEGPQLGPVVAEVCRETGKCGVVADSSKSLMRRSGSG